MLKNKYQTSLIGILKFNGYSFDMNKITKIHLYYDFNYGFWSSNKIKFTKIKIDYCSYNYNGILQSNYKIFDNLTVKKGKELIKQCQNYDSQIVIVDQSDD